MPVPSVPNTSEVARRLGVSRSAVSRFRNGSRVPRIGTQAKIAREYRWSVRSQAAANAAGEWTAEFNRVLQRASRVSAAAK